MTADDTSLNRAKAWRRWIRRLVAGLVLVFAGGAVWAGLKYRAHMRVPDTRLSLDAHYPSLPPGPRAHYVNLPLDHNNPLSGEYRGFYHLSPRFDPEEPVVFFLTDGQMELVGTDVDFEWFDAELGGLSYVLIGRRGHAPTLFPEVFRPDGSLDYSAAMQLYGSWQHVEDIERVRLDMVSKGLLPNGGKIMLFGASGAGFLVQQFLHRHGEHVRRALIQASSAPDIACAKGWRFSQDLEIYDPEANRMLRSLLDQRALDRPSLGYLLFQIGRRSTEPRSRMRAVAENMANGKRPVEYGWMTVSGNLTLAKLLLKGPASAAGKVRMTELLGQDLLEYRPGRSPINLMYEWTPEILSEFLAAREAGAIQLPDLTLDRSSFLGEVFVMAGADDVVFSERIHRAIADSYENARLAVFDEGHRFQKDQSYYLELRRAFFRDGFESPSFKTLFHDPRNRNATLEQIDSGERH